MAASLFNLFRDTPFILHLQIIQVYIAIFVRNNFNLSVNRQTNTRPLYQGALITTYELEKIFMPELYQQSCRSLIITALEKAESTLNKEMRDKNYSPKDVNAKDNLSAFIRSLQDKVSSQQEVGNKQFLESLKEETLAKTKEIFKHQDPKVTRLFVNILMIILFPIGILLAIYNKQRTGDYFFTRQKSNQHEPADKVTAQTFHELSMKI